MNMQDKELDALFRDNLENMEVQPSANLWAGIAAGLDRPGAKKRSLVPYYGIAATITVLLTAGLIFMPKDETKPQENMVVKVKTQSAKKTVEPKSSVEITEDVPVVKAQPKAAQIAAVHQASPKAKETDVLKKQPAEIIVTAPDVLQQQQPVIAAVTPKTDSHNPVVPDKNVPLTQKNIQPETEPFKTNPVVMAKTNLPQAEIQQGQPEKKKRSRGLGGLLSSLVAKIDKREDKLVEFDDNQKLTGINLGILKITTEQE